MNREHWKIVNRLMLVAVVCGSLVAGGCEGTDTREQVDDTVEEMAGKKDLERYQQMKDNLDKVKTQQTDRYHQLDEATD